MQIPKNQNIDYLALGDSYTIGESVEVGLRWPVQLARALENRGYDIGRLEIIAKTGWSTDELINALEQRALQDTFDMVSLLIGVNNQYRGLPLEQYKKEFSQLLDSALHYAGGKEEAVFVVAIPDYGVTPFGSEKADTIYKELKEYNAIAEKISKKKNVAFLDIFELSRAAKDQPIYIADDNLHPSAEMYTLWTNQIIKELFPEEGKKE